MKIKYYKKSRSEAEEAELWNAYKENRTVQNRNSLVLLYLPLLEYPVNKVYPICRSSNELEDIFQSAVLGLIDAVEGFRDTGGASFKTFSRLRIHGSIIDYLRRTSLMGVPYHARKKFAEENIIDGINGGSFIPQIISLDELGENDENSDFISNLLVDLSESAEDVALNRIIMEKIIGYMNDMPIDEYTVLTQYYFKNKTLDEIAAALDVSRKTVWQLRGKAIKRIRKAMSIQSHGEFSK